MWIISIKKSCSARIGRNVATYESQSSIRCTHWILSCTIGDHHGIADKVCFGISEYSVLIVPRAITTHWRKRTLQCPSRGSIFLKWHPNRICMPAALYHRAQPDFSASVSLSQIYSIPLALSNFLMGAGHSHKIRLPSSSTHFCCCRVRTWDLLTWQ